MSAPAQKARSFSRSSSAAARPSSGSPPAPRPRVRPAPRTNLAGAGQASSDWESVLMARKSTPAKAAWEAKPTALQPAPPTPKTLRDKFLLDGRRSGVVSMGVVMVHLLKISTKVFFRPLGEAVGRACALLQGAEFDQADGGGEFRLVQGGFEAADGVGLAEEGGQLKDVPGQFAHAGNAGPAAAEEDAGAQAVEQAQVGKLRTRSTRKVSSRRRDMMRRRCSRLTILAGKPKCAGGGEGLALDGGIEQGGAVFELQLFGAAQGDLQTVSQVVGDVVAADGQDAGVFDNALGIDDVIRWCRRRGR